MTSTSHTQVGIIGAGPAGLVLSRLLARAGIDSIVVDQRSRSEIETTVRAGILEQAIVDLLVDLVPGTRVLTDGQRHDGIEFRFDGAGHRIDFAELAGQAVWLYPQHEVLIDLLASLIADGADLRLGVTASAVLDADTDTPRITGVDEHGVPFEIVADFVVGADGSRGIARAAVSGPATGERSEDSLYAWLGMFCEAPPSARELIYSTSKDGFALISQRSPTLQRLYLQCDPDLDPYSLSEAQIWDALHARVPGATLTEGPLISRDVLRFRRFVAPRLRRGTVFLVGDAAHILPPTGAKGLNLAVADVQLLGEALIARYLDGSTEFLDRYEEKALERIDRTQEFAGWMTRMLHVAPGSTDADQRARLDELSATLEQPEARRSIAQAYTGWPFESSTSAMDRSGRLAFDLV